MRRATDALNTAREIFEQQAPPANYSTALDWLLGLNDKEYTKMTKIVEIYRRANTETAKALGIKTEPTSFLPQPDSTEPVPQDVNHLSPASAGGASDDSNFLDEDDELAAAFLEDEPPAKAPNMVTTPNGHIGVAEAPAKPPVKVDVKDDNDKPEKPKG